jgi:hypothetical protein
VNSRASVVDAIFAKCLLVYGHDFLARWQGIALAEVKADWGRELGVMLSQPHAIKHALENLPERPPNALQFRALCFSYRPPVRHVELPAPIPRDPERVRVFVDNLKRKLAEQRSQRGTH